MTKFWTIGFPGGSAQQIISALKAKGIRRVVDARDLPRGEEAEEAEQRLRAEMEEAGLDYVEIPAVGPPPVTGGSSSGPQISELNNTYQVYNSRRYYELNQLSSMIEETPTAIICTEVEHGKCTGSLITQMLQVRGYEVEHL